MEDWYFHIIDIAHGVVMAIMVYFIFRLLVFRKEGPLRVRYLAAGLLVLALLQTLESFDEGSPNEHIYEVVTLFMDGCAMFLSILILWLFYRSRHVYPRRVIRYGSAILISIIVCYFFCALFRFAEWTYPVYLIVSTVGWTLFCLVIERIEDKEGIIQSLPLNKASQQMEEFCKQLDEVMHKDNLFCNEELTREEVCRAMYTNRTTFSQKLKQAYDKTFSEYLRDMRLEEAARLLRETDMPIDQIAFSVGLKSPAGFYRNFLLSFGMTPAQYRLRSTQKH